MLNFITEDKLISKFVNMSIDSLLSDNIPSSKLYTAATLQQYTAAIYSSNIAAIYTAAALQQYTAAALQQYICLGKYPLLEL